MAQTSKSIRQDRSIIVIEQRGTSRSNALCPSLSREFNTISAQSLSEEEATKRSREVVADCFDELRAEGRDPDGYTNLQNALDIRDVRQALGVEVWNVWGFSYGTALAQEVLRQDGDAIRTIVFDGSVPLDFYWSEDSIENYIRTVGLLDGLCKSQPQCADEFGDLSQLYRDAFARLVVNPIDLSAGGRTPPHTDFIFDAADLSDLLFGLLYDPGNYEIVPLLLSSIADEDPAVAEAIFRATLPQLLFSSIDYGTYFAIACRMKTRSSREHMAYRLESADSSGAFDLGVGLAEVCSGLQLSPAAAEQLEPISSPKPALFLSGQLDPITPPHFAEHVAAGFPNAQSVVLQGESHGVSATECGLELVQRFLKDPLSKLDTQCTESTAPLRFAANITPSAATRWLLMLNRGLFGVQRAGQKIIPALLTALIGLLAITGHFARNDSGSRRTRSHAWRSISSMKASPPARGVRS
ncbi:MAG: alpha/beta fold hydrolase, partial [Pseudomonadota bacterium]